MERKHTGGRIAAAHRTRSSRTSRASTVGLPDDLLDKALGRLRTMAIVVAVVLTSSITLNYLMHRVTPELVPLPALSVAARGMGLVVAILTWFLSKQEGLSRQLRCDFGLVFEVVIALSLAVTEFTMLPMYDIPVGATSAAAMWILIFRVIVPTAPAKSLLAAIASASMIPVALMVSGEHGLTTASLATGGALMKTTFGAAVISVIVAKVVHGMGRAVAEAREMGAYRLDELLGKGGMGEVWRASHRMLKRPAAIKLVRSDHLATATEDARRSALARFEREAQATAALESVHTVQLFDFGTADDGAFFYVMELLDGLDLETLVQEHGPQPPERVLSFLSQACHSLADAHEQGLVHRDIKPSNIFTCRLGGDRDFVKVLDFGLVKASVDVDPDAIQLTADGVATGTPAYMPPEVALGTKNVGPMADLYSLGCVGYWLLTGQLVFTGETGMAIVSQHISVVPEPVSARSELDIPADLEAVIMACLAKQPEDRPPSARILRDRLLACNLANPWTQDRARDWWRNHAPAAPERSSAAVTLSA